MTYHHIVEVRGPQYAIALDAIVMGTAQTWDESQSVDSYVIPFLRIVVVLLLLPIPPDTRVVGVVDVRLGGRAVGGGWTELGLLVGIGIHAVRVSAGKPAICWYHYRIPYDDT